MPDSKLWRDVYDWAEFDMSPGYVLDGLQDLYQQLKPEMTPEEFLKIFEDGN